MMLYNKKGFLKGAKMEFLIDPNVAYVLLVLGSVLILLAIVTPGTGLIEVGALFILALSGYAILKLGFNMWALVLLVMMLVPFVYATRKPKRRIYLAVSILMLIVGSIYLYPTQGLNPAVNPFLAILVSLLTGAFVWLIVQNTTAAMHAHPSHDLQRLVGQIGETKTVVHHEGSVQVDGELWTARSEKRIPDGRRVRVLKREGFILIIEEDDQAVK
jgi:membrane-bound ClpP family serine protease